MKTITVRLPRGEEAGLMAFCVNNNRSRNSVIREFIRGFNEEYSLKMRVEALEIRCSNLERQLENQNNPKETPSLD